MRSRWIDYNKIKIFYVDFSNFEQDLDLFQAEFEEITPIVKQQPENSVLGLVDLRNTALSIEITALIKGFAPRLAPHIRKAAVLVNEITGFKRVIFSAIARLGRREIVLFDNDETAKNWLTDGR